MSSSETVPVSFRCAMADWNTLPTSAQSERKKGATLTRISLVSRTAAMGNDWTTEFPNE